MDLELRAVTGEELPAFVRACELTFGMGTTDDKVERVRTLLPLERTLAAFDGDEIVGTAGAFDFTITLPGGDRVPTAGVTFVGVLPTHRRRGILRSMMAAQLDDVAERGEAFAVLTASESSIYGRFGYGEASRSVDWTLDPRGLDLVREPDAPGRVRIVDAARIRQVAPGIYERAIAGIPGTMPRKDAWWDAFEQDPEDWRDGGPAMFHAVHETPVGEADGFVSWRAVDRWTPDDLPDTEIRVQELFGVDEEVDAALFRFVLDMDLVSTVKGSRRPVDDHLRWRLVDRRRMVQRTVDGLYVRILDPGPALAARRYAAPGALVVDLVDPFRPHTEGRWLVEGGPDGAACSRTDRDPDLALPVTELGSIYLGGVSPSALARAGRVEERTPGALARADAFFGWGVAPWLTTGF